MPEGAQWWNTTPAAIGGYFASVASDASAIEAIGEGLLESNCHTYTCVSGRFAGVAAAAGSFVAARSASAPCAHSRSSRSSPKPRRRGGCGTEAIGYSKANITSSSPDALAARAAAAAWRLFELMNRAATTAAVPSSAALTSKAIV